MRRLALAVPVCAVIGGTAIALYLSGLGWAIGTQVALYCKRRPDTPTSEADLLG